MTSLPDIDLMILGLLGLFAAIGWWQGFTRSLLGPLGFIVGLWSGILNFDLSDNLILSVWVGVAVNVCVTAGGYLLILLFRQTLGKEERQYVHWGSRTSGAAVNTIWNGIALGVILTVVTLMPPLNPTIGRLKTDLRGSLTYEWFYNRVVRGTPALQQIVVIINTFGNPTEFAAAAAAPEFKEFFEHPKMVALTEDPAYMQALARNDWVAVSQNPKVQDAIHDRRLMRRLTISSKAYFKRRMAERAMGRTTPAASAVTPSQDR